MIPTLLMYSTHKPTDGHLARLAGLGCDVTVANDEPTALAAAPAAEIILGHRYLRQSLPAAGALHWVHSTAGGINHLPLEALAAKKVLLTRSVCMSGAIARHAHTCAWAVTRQLPNLILAQHHSQWQPAQTWLPHPQRAVVFGTGSIGGAISELLARDGIAVTGINRRTPDWRGLLPVADWIFVALPARRETVNLLDRAALETLKPTALVVLVGREETMDLNALCDLLNAGKLGGAAVDLIPPSWRTPEHPAWHTPRLMITPHVASHATERAAMNEHEAEEQVRRYVEGESLANLVNYATEIPWTSP